MKFKTNAIRFLFISILGVLLHFTYEWSDDNRIVGLFSAVNESTCCLLYSSPSPRDAHESRMPSSA